VPAKIPDLYGFGPEGAPLLCLGHTGDIYDIPPHTPNSPVAHVDDFWSYHAQGANFLMVDGSVRSINNNINPVTWRAMGTCEGGETFTLPD
jgi:prepilin-type processing-associated H-X9-DG protein